MILYYHGVERSCSTTSQVTDWARHDQAIRTLKLFKSYSSVASDAPRFYETTRKIRDDQGMCMHWHMPEEMHGETIGKYGRMPSDGLPLPREKSKVPR